MSETEIKNQERERGRKRKGEIQLCWKIKNKGERQGKKRKCEMRDKGKGSI